MSKISPSQLDRARGCLRQWAWDRLTPRSPPSAEQQLGTDVHKVLELYQTEGTAPDRNTEAGRIALPALEHVPPPKTGHAEGHWVRTWDGITYQGYIDLVAGQVTYDYKTKKSFNHVFVTKQDFLADPQATLYAKHTGLPWLKWLYLKTEGAPKALPVTVEVTPVEVERAYQDRVRSLADVLVTIRAKGVHPLDLPPNPGQCRKYGERYACPHEDRCKLTPVQRLLGESPVEDLLDQLRRQLGATPAADHPLVQSGKAFEPVPDMMVPAAVAQTTPVNALRALPQVNPPEAATQVALMASGPAKPIQEPAQVAPAALGLTAPAVPAVPETKPAKGKKPAPTPDPTEGVSDAELGAAVKTLLKWWRG